MIYYRLPLYILFGVLPSLIWLFYYLKKDLHPEPKRKIIKVFFYGVLITIPAFLIQVGLSGLLQRLQYSGLFVSFPIIIEFLKWFLVIAFTEEALKYFVVKYAILNDSATDEPIDIMLYMVVSALGFAAVENILYLFSPIYNSTLASILGTAVLISFIRFIGATFLHTLCSALLGYFLALSEINIKNKLILTFLGIFLATMLHGIYNFSIMILPNPMNFIIPALVIMSLIAFMVYDFDRIKKLSSVCNLN